MAGLLPGDARGVAADTLLAAATAACSAAHLQQLHCLLAPQGPHGTAASAAAASAALSFLAPLPAAPLLQALPASTTQAQPLQALPASTTQATLPLQSDLPPHSLCPVQKRQEKKVVVRRSHLAAALARVKQRTATEGGAPQVRTVEAMCKGGVRLSACVASALHQKSRV